MRIKLYNYFSPLQTISLEADFLDNTNIPSEQWNKTSNDKKQLLLNNEQAVKTLLDSNEITFEQLISFCPSSLKAIFEHPSEFLEFLKYGLLEYDSSKLNSEQLSYLLDFPFTHIVPRYLSLSGFFSLDMSIIETIDQLDNNFTTLFERGLQDHQIKGFSCDDIRYFAHYLSHRNEIDISTFADQILVIPKDFRILFFQHPEHLKNVSDNVDIFEQLLKELLPKETHIKTKTTEGYQLVSYPHIFFNNIETCQLLSKNKIDLTQFLALSSTRLMTIFTYPNDFLCLCNKLNISPQSFMLSSEINDDKFHLLVTEHQKIIRQYQPPDNLHKNISTICTTPDNYSDIFNIRQWHPDVLRKLEQLGVTPPLVNQGTINKLISLFENYEIFMNLHRKGVDITALFSFLSLSRIEVLLLKPEVIIRYKDRLDKLENISINDWIWQNKV